MMHLFITDSDFSCTNRIFQYLLGFQPTLWAILLDDVSIVILLDGRYVEKTKNIDEDILRQRVWQLGLKINIVQIEEFLPWIIEQLGDFRELSIEENIAIKYVKEIQNSYPDLSIQTKVHEISEKRRIKNKEEQEYIIKAVDVIDEVFLYILSLAKKWELCWKTELQVQGIIVSKIFELGGESESFDSIVAFWENSAIPHHSSWDTLIGNGPLLIDMWAKYQWYCSDFTRTFWVWDKTELHGKFTEILDIVAKAHEASIIVYNKGMTGTELNNMSRAIIKDAGYDELYTHGLGHGVWLDIHEEPKISKTWKEILSEGMVFTIEPGIYLPGEFWVRLEDIVFLQRGKLNKYSKVPLILQN